MGAHTKDHASSKKKRKARQSDKAEKIRRKACKARRRISAGPKKKKCCRSSPRCSGCPTVIHRLRRCGAFELDDKALLKAVKKARRW